MKYLFKIVMAIVLLGFAGMTYAEGDATAGKEKSSTCAACHGAEGISPNDLWPNLAGQKFGYLVKQLKAFRDGDRSDPMMSPMSTGLSDEDINDLAAYFSSL